MSVSGLYFKHMKFEYKGELYTQEKFTFPIPSLHINGMKDEYAKF